MNNRFLFLALAFCVWSGARSYAEVWDLTDPSHPVALSTGVPVNDEDAPSYDCAKARTATEKLICGNAPLAANDRQLATLYQALNMCLPAAGMAPIRAAQKKWLAARAACASTANDADDAVNQAAILCLHNAFHQRIDELLTLNHQCVDVGTASSPTAWKTYRDERYKFSISFPQTLATSTEFTGYYHVSADVWRLGFQNSEHPDDHGIPVISIIIDRPKGDNAYPDTEIRIGVHAGKSAQEACGAQDGDSERTQTINGQAFNVSDLWDAGMSQYVTGTSYQTFHGGYCYAIESFSTGSSAAETDDDAGKSAHKAAPIDPHSIESIISTFQFLKK